jgi:glyoxylase-like metal-dependent hydrolase (beta-lactamase superfamily II)/rhodanese-related sulfurtransferase
MSRLLSCSLVLFSLTAVAGPRPTAGASSIEDAESASHEMGAAEYQVIETYAFPGLKLFQFDLAVLAHYSYLVVSGNDAVVVDPGRDVDAYLEAAETQGVTIKAVWLSHSHADFVAGHVEIASRLGVPILISQQAGARYDHRSLRENDTLEFGQAVIRFVETPGHTLDSMCGIVSNKQDPEKPLAVLSGDTLFVGSVGRPDLLGDDMSASTLAGLMYDTWNNKLARLPNEVVVLPAHGAGSLCGAELGDVPSTTIGEQKASNPFLQQASRSEFVAAVVEGLPVAPQYFAHNAALNRDGPPPAQWQFESLPMMKPSEELTDPVKYFVVDFRDAGAYATRGHIPNSVNIGLRGRFESWLGRMVPWEMNGDRLVLAGIEPQDFREALRRLKRVGYDARVVSLAEWKAAGLPLAMAELVTPGDLSAEMRTPDAPLIVDVREPREWEELRIGTVINIPLEQLPVPSNTLDRRDRIVTVCNSAYRSSMAIGLLERRGYHRVANLKGGTDAWIDARLPYYDAGRPSTLTPVASPLPRLPERVDAAELKRMLMDLPGTFQVVDIRPADQYADYHLPGSFSVPLSDVLAADDYLEGQLPLVIVDRDGSIAMMIAGILAQKSSRPIKALYGGLQAYWREAGLGATIAPSMLPTRPSAQSGGSTSAPITPRIAPPATRKKRRSAGC